MNSRIVSILIDSFPKILVPGLLRTIPLTAASFSIALVVAVAAALIQFADVKGLKQLCRLYIWVIRGTPLLVQLFVVFYGLPHVGVVIDPFPAAIAVFSINEGAYAAEIIHTFLESYDFTGKTIVPFCTSGSSPYNDGTIRPLAPDADWRTGQRFGSGVARSAVESWMDGLDLPTATEEEENQMYLQVGDTVWTATLEDNPSVTAWRELLAQGPLTVEMHDYGGFEKVGDIGTTLTRSDRQITTKPGDIILYQGNSVTIYYGENSWNFTPLGHVNGVAEAELRQVLKAGGENVSVTFSLKDPAEL